MNPDAEKNLEQFIARTLRDQPLRRAPRSLESRVLAALEQRAALPWWRQSFAHWPVAVRAVFFAASAAIAAVLVWALGGFDLEQSVNTVTTTFAWVDTLRGAVDSLTTFCGIVFRSISPVWIYGGAAAFLALYAALFGLGAAAYRTLIANR